MKIHNEFDQGSKLPGTCLEAVLLTFQLIMLINSFNFDGLCFVICSPVIRKLIPPALPDENYHIIFTKGLQEKKEGKFESEACT